MRDSEVDENGIDIRKLETYLVEHKAQLPLFELPLSLKQFGHGQSNPTYLVSGGRSGSNLFVLRKQPGGDILSKTAHRIDREYSIMNTLRLHSDVPVPTVYLLCQDHSVIGKPFYIMQYCEGRVFTDTHLRSLSQHHRLLCWTSLIDTLALIHNIHIDKVGLSHFAPNGGINYFGRQCKTLSRVSLAQQASSKLVPSIPGFEQLKQKLLAVSEERREQLVDEVCICHGDFKLDNVIFHKTEPKVIAVIDWEMSTLGHYGADLANCVSPFFIEQCPSIPDSATSHFGAIQPSSIEQLGLPTGQQLVTRYCQQRAPCLNIQEESKLIWYYLAFYWWKNAVIFQGIAARSLRGQASSKIAHSVGQVTPYAAQLAQAAFDLYERTISKL